MRVKELRKDVGLQARGYILGAGGAQGKTSESFGFKLKLFFIEMDTCEIKH